MPLFPLGTGLGAAVGLARGALTVGAIKLGPGLTRACQQLLQQRPHSTRRAKQQGLGEAERSEELRATKGAERYYQPNLGAKLFDLSGSVAFVTGSAQGMGAAIALGLAQSGAKVVVSDVVGEEGMGGTLEAIKKAGGQALAVQCDVRDRKSVDEAVKRAASEFGSVDVMVANAGILGKLCHADAVTKQSWNEVLSTNLEGAYNCARAAYPYMKEQARGKVILMSAIAGIRGFGAQVAYCVSKGGLLPLAKSLAVAWGKDNIQVNCLLPGAINTPFLDQVLNTPQKVDYILHRIPAGRLGVAEDVVGPCIFLASKASDYITGTEIVVDGGGVQVPMLADQNPEDYKV